MAEAKPEKAESLDLLAVPMSPLVFRSGQPFGETGQTGGSSPLHFPLPGSIAGGVRAAWCEATGQLPRAGDAVHSVLDSIHLQGPLRCTREGNALEFWYPRPMDAEIDSSRLYRRLPTVPPVGSDASELGGCDLPSGLLPLTRSIQFQNQPAGGLEGASWWSAQALVNWLKQAGTGEVPQMVASQVMGDLPGTREVHIAVDGSRQVVTGRLFVNQTVNFRVLPEHADKEQGLWMRVTNKGEPKNLEGITGKPWRLGADGAAAWFTQLSQGSPESSFDVLANAMRQVKLDSVVCLYLATPAYFARNGWYPDGLAPQREADDERERFIKPRPAGMAAGSQHDGDDLPLVGRLVGWPEGSQVRLLAAAVDSFVPYSGWKQRQPKRSVKARVRSRHGGAMHPVTPPRDSELQRLVPAGSLYWFKVTQWPDSAAHFKWKTLLLQSCCRVEHARDGLGLAVYALVKR